MNWDAIGAVGEIVGAIAVLVSLLYLAVQVKASSLQNATTIEQEVIASFSELDQIMAGNERYSKIAAKVISGESLSLDEEVSYSSQWNRVFLAYYSAHIAHQNKQIPKKQYDMYCRSLRYNCDRWTDGKQRLKDWLHQMDPNLEEEFMSVNLLETSKSESIRGHWDTAFGQDNSDGANET